MRIQFSDLCSPEFKRNPFPLLAKLREGGPFVDLKIPVIGKFRLATTYDAVDQLLRDRNQFVIEPKNAGLTRWRDFRSYLPRSLRVLTQSMMQKDEPDHRRIRGLTEQAFRRHNVASMRDRVIALTDERLAEFSMHGQLDANDFAREIPLGVICELLGLPLADRSKFSRWVKSFTQASFPWGLATTIPNIVKLNRYLRGRFEAERQAPTGGLISELVAAEEAGDRLSEDELLATVFLLLVAGHETTTHLISLSLLTLLTAPEQRSQWLDEPDVRGTGVDELIRFLSTAQISKPRYSTSDGQVCGVDVGRTEKFIGMLAAANSDPAKFSKPETIDLRRAPNPHLGLGSGIHFCLGAQLARLETEIALTRFLEHFPNATLAVPESELVWSKKIGMRILKGLPVNLTS